MIRQEVTRNKTDGARNAAGHRPLSVPTALGPTDVPGVPEVVPEFRPRRVREPARLPAAATLRCWTV